MPSSTHPPPPPSVSARGPAPARALFPLSPYRSHTGRSLFRRGPPTEAVEAARPPAAQWRLLSALGAVHHFLIQLLKYLFHGGADAAAAAASMAGEALPRQGRERMAAWQGWVEVVGSFPWNVTSRVRNGYSFLVFRIAVLLAWNGVNMESEEKALEIVSLFNDGGFLGCFSHHW